MYNLMKIILSTFLVIIFTSCSNNEPILGTKTPKEIPTITELSGNQFIYVLHDDGMLSSNQFADGAKLVIDPDYYQSREVSRGDIVFLKTNASQQEMNEKGIHEYDITRVIGLPNETVRIDIGQIYIDERKLSAFYGNQNYALAGQLKPEAAESMKNLKLSQDQYFLMGDLWFRSYGNSIYRGPFVKDKIKGKIIGVMK